MLYGGIMSGKTCVYIRYLEKKFAYGTHATIGQLSLASKLSRFQNTIHCLGCAFKVMSTPLLEGVNVYLW